MEDDNRAKRLRQLDNTLAVVGIGLLLIACLAIWGMADAATHQAMAEHASAVARCKSIEGAEWGGDACYYNGVKLNFKEGFDAPEED